MKYTVDSNNQTIVIHSSFKYEDFIATFKKYEGYKITVDNIPKFTYVYN